MPRNNFAATIGDKQGNYIMTESEAQETLDYYGEQLKTIRGRCRQLEIEAKIAIDEAKMYKRERNFLLPLVISLVLLIATPL